MSIQYPGIKGLANLSRGKPAKGVSRTTKSSGKSLFKQAVQSG
jgi:hypothetical protein